jgi:hypothetical protein
MWEPWRLTTLWTSAACYRDSFMTVLVHVNFIGFRCSWSSELHPSHSVLCGVTWQQKQAEEKFPVLWETCACDLTHFFSQMNPFKSFTAISLMSILIFISCSHNMSLQVLYVQLIKFCINVFKELCPLFNINLCHNKISHQTNSLVLNHYNMITTAAY